MYVSTALPLDNIECTCIKLEHVCVCVCVCVYVFMSACVHVCIWCKHTHMYVCVYV